MQSLQMKVVSRYKTIDVDYYESQAVSKHDIKNPLAGGDMHFLEASWKINWNLSI